MNAKQVLEMVQDMPRWRGDVYRLAMEVCAQQKEDDALKVEAAGNQELADAIRSE
jgi:hypothetical protein